VLFGKKAAPDDQVSALSRAILIEEHSSLRAEILASYGYAQSIVKWTLTAFVSISAAGLIAIYNAVSTDNAILVDVTLIIFGFGLPGIVWLNAWTWLGELYRAERAGSYLRAVEADIANVPGITKHLGFQPARWETFIWSNRKVRGLWGKQTITYLGTAGVFFGAAFGSVVILVVLWAELADNGVLHPAELAWLWPIGSALANAGCVIVCGVIYRRLMTLGDAVAPVPATL